MLPRPLTLLRFTALATLALSVSASAFAQGVAAPSAPSAAAPSAPPAAAPAPAAPVGPATPPAPLAESLTGMAKAEYGAARILYDDGDYQGALQKLKSSYDLSKDPRLLWNMAASEKNLRHYASVVRLIDRYVAEGGALVTAEDRASAQALIDTVKGFVTDFSIEVNEPGATVLIDDQPMGTTPLAETLHIDMGPHKIRVTRPGFLEFALAQEFAGGQPLHVNAQLMPERHEGRLRITASPHDVISVDGKPVGTGLWEAVLPSGTHAIYVTGKGKRPHQTEVVVQDNDVSTVNVSLQEEAKPQIIVEKSGVPTWLWITGGALLVGGGVGAYFLLKPGDPGYQTPTNGNWGAVELP